MQEPLQAGFCFPGTIADSELALAVQVIGLLKDAFVQAGLGLYVAPYAVVPTAYECGIIEIVPNCNSRAGLGETADGGLLSIFQREFGTPGLPRFEAARRNFLISSAGYASLLQTHYGIIAIHASDAFWFSAA